MGIQTLHLVFAKNNVCGKDQLDVIIGIYINNLYKLDSSHDFEHEVSDFIQFDCVCIDVQSS